MLIVFLVSSALRTKQATIEALRNDQTNIVVAARLLPMGATLDATNTRLATWPRANIPSETFSTLHEVVGRVVKESIVENQPIVPELLISSGKSAGILPLLIPPGMRAMSISVNPVSDMAGMILPNARVDVLVTTSAGVTSTNIERTGIVLQNIEVIAVQTTLETTSNEPRPAEVVTLLVSPTGAEQLAAAVRLGTVQLAMRNYSDQTSVYTTGVFAGQLLGGEPAMPPVAPPTQPLATIAPRPLSIRRVRVIEVFRDGKERQTVTFSSNRPTFADPSGNRETSESGSQNTSPLLNGQSDTSQ
jgi:pilus assembly protein CpaB